MAAFHFVLLVNIISFVNHPGLKDHSSVLSRNIPFNELQQHSPSNINNKYLLHVLTIKQSKMAAKTWLKLASVFCVVNQLMSMEDGVSYIIGSGKEDCFHSLINNGTTLDFEMEVGRK